MPTSKAQSQRRSPEPKNRRVRASSFHGRVPVEVAMDLPRPKTLPELLPWKNVSAGGGGLASPEVKQPRLTKLLLNVTIQGSLGPVHVVMSPEATVGDLVIAVVRLHVKELRRPILPTEDPRGFDLHYSQFSLESLNREEKLMALGSRNFFLCSKKKVVEKAIAGPSGSCSRQAKRVAKSNFSWLKLLDSLL